MVGEENQEKWRGIRPVEPEEEIPVKSSGSGDHFENIKLNTNYPVGTGVNGSVTLTLANTAYAVPSTASTKRHILVLYNGSDKDIYWGYQNTNANGIQLPSDGRIGLDLGAGQQVYLYCATAGKVITYTYKEIN